MKIYLDASLQPLEKRPMEPMVEQDVHTVARETAKQIGQRTLWLVRTSQKGRVGVKAALTLERRGPQVRAGGPCLGSPGLPGS